MSERFLPIYGEDEKLVRNPQLALRCLMAFPEDVPSARSASAVLGQESQDIKLGYLETYSQVGLAAHRLIFRGTQLNNLCGAVAFQMMINLEHQKKPDFEKAVFLVSEWASTAKNGTGKPFPSDYSRLRKTFNQLKSVIHYWAAHSCLDENEQDDLWTGENTFHKVMQLAFEIQVRFEEQRALRNWKPWRVPDRYVSEIPNGRWVFKLPAKADATTWHTNKMSTYTANITR